MDTRTGAQSGRRDAARILLVTATAGYRHGSIPTVWRTLPEIARERGDLAVATILKEADDLAGLTAARLAEHEILCLVHTSGDLPFSAGQKQAILDFVAAGNGFVGVHGATTICYDWAAYADLIGAHFKGHPPAATFTVTVEDGSHPSTRHLPSQFEATDELYTFRSNPRDVAQILLSAPPGSCDLEGDLPLAWTKTYGKGRVYYNALGHFDATWDEPAFRQQIGAGLRWAARLDAAT
jgi:type 1 glutamine amidotransferase